MAHSKLYKLNEAALAEYKAGNQAQLIIKSLMDHNPQTVRQIAEDIKASLQTRQDPVRVVNFYMSTWKKSGLVEVVGTTSETPVSNQDSKPEVEAGDDAQTEQKVVEPPPFNWADESLKACVLQALRQWGDQTVQDISMRLQMNGKTANPKQVNDAVSKLVKTGDVARNDGMVALQEHAHA